MCTTVQSPTKESREYPVPPFNAELRQSGLADGPTGEATSAKITSRSQARTSKAGRQSRSISTGVASASPTYRCRTMRYSKGGSEIAGTRRTP